MFGTFDLGGTGRINVNQTNQAIKMMVGEEASLLMDEGNHVSTDDFVESGRKSPGSHLSPAAPPPTASRGGREPDAGAAGPPPAGRRPRRSPSARWRRPEALPRPSPATMWGLGAAWHLQVTPWGSGGGAPGGGGTGARRAARTRWAR